MTPIDLHVHSNKSDGSLTPVELVDAALCQHLSAFALTDHDTVSGIKEAIDYAKDKNIRVIPGVELSAAFGTKDIHILGLFIDYTSPFFLKGLNSLLAERSIRNEKMCACFATHGISFSVDDLLREFPDSVLTRAHYAKYLLKLGVTKNIKEAFEKYIGDNGPCYIPRKHITPEEAISLILESGGIPILAHPVLYHFSNTVLDTLIGQLVTSGLMGIETTYVTYSSSETRQMKALAHKYHLLESGGSDFHGSAKPDIQIGIGRGQLFVPSTFLEEMNR